MKLERAQELYSDYAEGTLTPALRQALEQHFEADPAARAEYRQFMQVYALLDQPLGADVEVPLGFRAKILERVTAEQSRRETAPGLRAPGSVAGWFSTVRHRRATGGALAGLAAAAALGLLFLRPSPTPVTPVDSSSFGSGVSPAANIDPAVIRSVDVSPGQNGNASHQFHLHLPPSVTAATVNAYAVTGTEQITDPAQLSEATPALKAQHLTSDQGVEIPITPLQTPPDGATLNLLVQWTPDNPKQAAGSEVVFTPFGAASPATPAPAGSSFLDAMQAIASHYGATVIVDVNSVPTQTVSGDFSTADPGVPLGKIAADAGYSVQTLGNNTFYVYDPQP